ncbi:MAG TPA: hypothetical protein VGP47_06605 [Parachlamydiaceae bacterium]|nr:hypothetical protein [Parachlamydiaceae bacterium]
MVDIDNPNFSQYKSIDASDLVNKGINLSYGDDLVQFDPEYLRNIEVKSLHPAVQYEDFAALKRLAKSSADIQ